MKWIVGIMVLALAAAPALADPTGTYAVTGTKAGTGAAYQGTVTVSVESETYRVVWDIPGAPAQGVALGGAFSEGALVVGPAHPSDLMLAIGLTDTAGTGTATMFLQTDGAYEGFRASSGDHLASQERWVKLK